MEAVMPEFLTPGELATVLRICTKSVYKLLNGGEIPGSRKLGGNWVIHQDTFLAGFTKPVKAQKVNSGGFDPHKLT